MCQREHELSDSERLYRILQVDVVEERKWVVNVDTRGKSRNWRKKEGREATCQKAGKEQPPRGTVVGVRSLSLRDTDILWLTPRAMQENRKGSQEHDLVLWWQLYLVNQESSNLEQSNRTRRNPHNYSHSKRVGDIQMTKSVPWESVSALNDSPTSTQAFDF